MQKRLAHGFGGSTGPGRAGRTAGRGAGDITGAGTRPGGASTTDALDCARQTAPSPLPRAVEHAVPPTAPIEGAPAPVWATPTAHAGTPRDCVLARARTRARGRISTVVTVW